MPGFGAEGNLTLSVIEVSISSILSSTPELCSSTSCILFERLASECLVQLSQFFISRFPSIWVSLTDSISVSRH